MSPEFSLFLGLSYRCTRCIGFAFERIIKRPHRRPPTAGRACQKCSNTRALYRCRRVFIPHMCHSRYSMVCTRCDTRLPSGCGWLGILGVSQVEKQGNMCSFWVYASLCEVRCSWTAAVGLSSYYTGAFEIQENCGLESSRFGSGWHTNAQHMRTQRGDVRLLWLPRRFDTLVHSSRRQHSTKKMVFIAPLVVVLLQDYRYLVD